MDFKKYQENSGNKCPFCESTNISGKEMDTEGLQAFRNVECNACGKYWEETFVMTGIE